LHDAGFGHRIHAAKQLVARRKQHLSPHLTEIKSPELAKWDAKKWLC
jgi:hypothetical protein